MLSSASLHLETDIVGQFSQTTQQPFIAMMTVMVPIFTFIATIKGIFNAMQQHLATDNGRRTTERAHRQLAAAPLEEAALLPLHGHI